MDGKSQSIRVITFYPFLNEIFDIYVFFFFNRIPVELKGTVMCTAIREGGLKEWNFVYKFYKESKSKDEKAVYLNAMACSREPWVLSR